MEMSTEYQLDDVLLKLNRLALNFKAGQTEHYNY